MTEHDNHRAPAREPERREVRRETVVDTTGAAVPEVDVYQERVSGPTGDQVVRSEHISVPSEATRRAAEAARIKQVIYFIFGVINALLALRFVLLLLGANEASPFVSFIYTLSQPFTAPFQGIFNEPTFGGSVVEWASLVAIIVYMLISYGLARLVELMYAPARPDTTRNM